MTSLVWVLLAASPWEPLAEGVETRTLRLGTLDDVHVVRVTPGAATLDLALASQAQSDPRTASDWVHRSGAVAGINAGMFESDYRSNTGHLQCGKHINQAHWKSQYQSVLAFRPKDPKLPAFTMVDLDQSGAHETLEKYECLVQNLRLIRAPGENVWQPTKRKWSEAAAALDKDGRLLLLFSRKPISMDAYAKALLDSDLDVVRAMHLEGGPEASLSLRAGKTVVDLNGSFETGFVENDSVASQQPLPNVLLVVARH
jgi:hypothetical protein